MFNGDQQSHMKYVSTLKAREKCRCGWYAKYDCYTCNVMALFGAGGKQYDTPTGMTRYTLPDGTDTDYTGVTHWLRSNKADA